MKNVVLLRASLALVLAAVSGAAAMADMAPWVKQNGCYNCHHKSNPLVGPAFKAMAAKHRADPAAAQIRFEKVLRTGAGHPKSSLDEAQMKELTLWILQH